jgi:hypothetical protein
MTESRGDDLRKDTAQGARLLGRTIGIVGVSVNSRGADGGKMAELVNDRALLRQQQQQPETQRLE